MSILKKIGHELGLVPGKRHGESSNWPDIHPRQKGESEKAYQERVCKALNLKDAGPSFSND